MRRRSFPFLLIAILLLAASGAGCSDQTPTTTSLGDGDVEVTPSTTPHVTSDGVVLRVAASAFTNLDPAGASSSGDILLLHQVYDWLIEEDGEGGLLPALALSWEETAPTVWILKLRPNVIFHDGESLEAQDVVYTFDRLSRIGDSTGRGTSLEDFANIDAVIAVDVRTVRFVLTSPDPEFPFLLARDAAAVLSSIVDDPSREWVGTGPFVLWSYGAEDGAILRRNPAYWMMDASSRRLPYLDGIDFVFETDQQDSLDALLAGDVDFVGGLSVEESSRVAETAGFAVLHAPSNEHLSVDIASGPGRLGADPRVLRALKLGTDRAALTDNVRSTLGTPGNDSPVGPLYGALHLTLEPAYDPDAARALLLEAGYEQGLTLTLEVPDDAEALQTAEAWRAQMQVIGVTVEIREAGLAAADESPADAIVTRHISEPRPIDSLKHAHAAEPADEGAGWSDAGFNDVMTELATESDEEARIVLYHEAQSILMERGPSLVPFFEAAVAGADAGLLGVTLAPHWPRTTFRAASFGD